MATKSDIEWTGYTWNPLTGCTKISPGCKNCYAERMSKRLKAMKVKKYSDGFKLRIHEDILEEPLRWKKPRVVFVNSMSDLFHKEVPTDFILQVFDVMGRAKQHTFQILTKRSHRILDLNGLIDWPGNVLMGVSVESSHYTFRIDHLRETNAVTKFLSLEPLLGPLSGLDVTGIDWVIVGGESGPKARSMDAEWVKEIRDNCLDSEVPFFFKQWGGTRKKKMGRLLDGRLWNEMPISFAT